MKREYREVLEKNGIRLLDVYRHKDRDLIRFSYKGKVYTIELKGFFDAMRPEELLNTLLSRVEGR